MSKTLGDRWNARRQRLRVVLNPSVSDEARAISREAAAVEAAWLTQQRATSAGGFAAAHRRAEEWQRGKRAQRRARRRARRVAARKW